MKKILITLLSFFSGVTLFAHTITFGTSVNDKGVLTGTNTLFSLKQGGSVTCVINHTAVFSDTRFVLKTYEQYGDAGESLKETIMVDVHTDWKWATQTISFMINQGNYAYRVALFSLKGEELCSSKLEITIIPEGALFIDGDKLTAFNSIWSMMTGSVANTDIAIITGSAKTGGASGTRKTVSLAEGKETQVTAFPAGSYIFMPGKIKFNYTLTTNTTGTPEVVYEVTATEKATAVGSKAKLGVGSWKLSIVDEKGAVLGTSEFEVTK